MNGNKTITLKKGFDIKLEGAADKKHLEIQQPSLFALKPTDLFGISPIPKLHGKIGDEVKAGEPLFYDKPRPEVQYAAPVSGEIVEVRRGPKRRIDEVVILADSQMNYREYDKLDPATASRESIVNRLLEAGGWVLMRQRPYNVVPNPELVPKNIFISCFDSAPLGADQNFVMEGQEEDFQAGLLALGKLTDGSVYLGLSPHSADIYKKATGVVKNTFRGKHPAGNVGIQIHHTAPINKGEVVWVIKPQDVAIIGRLMTQGIFDARRTVAVTGSELKQTGYWKTRIGASFKPVFENNTKQENVRYISGNVLTGTRIKSDGFLGLFDDMVTVIEEGDEPEFMGWLLPSYPRPSVSRSFLAHLFPNRRYTVNTNNHGEERAYVMTGQYEKVLPMDLFPQHLIKSIMYMDFDQMEGLGIYEVVEEDLALCEFACTSKQPVMQILREGLDAMRIEG